MTGAQPAREKVARDLAIAELKPLPPPASAADMVADTAAEELLIGAVLSNDTVFDSVSNIVSAADFYVLWHGFVWWAISNIIERDEKPDLPTVQRELELKEQGDLDRLAGLRAASSSDAAQHAHQYAKRIRSAAFVLRTQRAASQIQRATLDPKFRANPRELANHAAGLLDVATERVYSDETLLWHSAASEIDKMETRSEPSLLSSGFERIDASATFGAAGYVSILAGSSGMGKTRMMMNLLANALRRGERHLLCSMEMSRAELLAILWSLEVGIPPERSMFQVMNPVEIQLLRGALERMKDWKLHVLDRIDYNILTPMQLKAEIRQHRRKHGHLNGVWVDGLWLMRDDSYVTDEAANMRIPPAQQAGNVSYKVADIAAKMKVPIVMAHQYNTNVNNRNDKRPVLTDLAYSTEVQRNTQYAWGMYRPSYYDRGASKETELHCLKSRHGSQEGQYFAFDYDANFSRYRSLR